MPQSRRIAVISADRFAGKAWRRPAGYTFAAAENIVPLVAAELAKAVAAMPLGFVQTEQGFQLVAVTALQPGTNLFVAPDGRWLGPYVPAALRGYPFLLVKFQDREESVLCIDEASGLVVEAGQGEPFFGNDGQPGKALKDMLDFLSQMERSRVVTQASVDALGAAGLIQPWPLAIQQGGQNLPVTGLHRIDEAALNALSDEAFIALRPAGALSVAYIQLLSLNQLAVLTQMAQVQEKFKAQVPAAVQNLKGLKGIGLSVDNGTLKFS